MNKLTVTRQIFHVHLTLSLRQIQTVLQGFKGFANKSRLGSKGIKMDVVQTGQSPNLKVFINN